VKISNTDSTLTAGTGGPQLLEDHLAREKIQHFDHERIPERVVHARGSAAHGYFECTHPAADITKASLFAAAGKRTPVFVRFSTVQGARGSNDLVRDVRGFAIKFQTENGVWDLVGNDIPVFFVQDATKFPDFVHAVKPEPHHDMPQGASAHDSFWDFCSLATETAHMLMWVMSPRGTPASLATIEGFGVNTFKFVSADGEARLVKFHFKPHAGLASMTWDETVKGAGRDGDLHRRQLWERLNGGGTIAWTMGVQVLPDAETCLRDWGINPLDATKIVPEEMVPVRELGTLVLNRNPDNFFAETEQVSHHNTHSHCPKLGMHEKLSRSTTTRNEKPSTRPLTLTLTRSYASHARTLRSPSARRTWCPASTSATTLCSRVAFFRTRTRSSRAWARTLLSCRSTRHTAP
jgi:catalase